jgi:hypothetical protein
MAAKLNVPNGSVPRKLIRKPQHKILTTGGIWQI